MEPTNQKVLYHKLMDSIDKVLSGEITPTQGKTISELAARMNKAKDLEHSRVIVAIQAEQHAQHGGSVIKVREIEGKNFE
jgi:hypothetical protein